MCVYITIQSAVSELLGVSNIKEWSSAIGTSSEEEEEEEETQAVGTGAENHRVTVLYIDYEISHNKSVLNNSIVHPRRI